MIQNILLFSLGFICALFLALMVAPILWRRVVKLTRRKIEASIPLSANEIQADKDRMRAEFAMSTRRLEMSVGEFREKAAVQVAEINRNREELHLLSQDRTEKSDAISQLEAQGAGLRKELAARERQLDEVTERLHDTEHRLEKRALELEQLSSQLNNVSLDASSRQVELISREAQIDKMNTDIDALQSNWRDSEKNIMRINNEKKVAQEALALERDKLVKIQEKNDRLLASLADRNETLDRREKELLRLREEIKDIRKEIDGATGSMVDHQSEKIQLESDLAQMSLKMTNLLNNPDNGDVDQAVGMLKEERERMQKQIRTLEEQNQQLTEKLAVLEQGNADEWDDQRTGNALVREQINDLAAQVIALTAALEGSKTPLNGLLERYDDTQHDGARVVSLADRVRSLQKAAAKNAN